MKPFKFNFKREVDRYIFDYFPLLMCVLYNIIFSQYSPLSATEMATVMAAAKKTWPLFPTLYLCDIQLLLFVYG